MSDYSLKRYDIDEIPADIIEELDLNTDDCDTCMVFDSLEDFAIYEVEDGFYFSIGCGNDIDYHGAPDLLNYIDYQALGEALLQVWDESCNCVLSDGRVVAFS